MQKCWRSEPFNGGWEVQEPTIPDTSLMPPGQAPRPGPQSLGFCEWEWGGNAGLKPVESGEADAGFGDRPWCQFDDFYSAHSCLWGPAQSSRCWGSSSSSASDLWPTSLCVMPFPLAHTLPASPFSGRSQHHSTAPTSTTPPEGCRRPDPGPDPSLRRATVGRGPQAGAGGPGSVGDRTIT